LKLRVVANKSGVVTLETLNATERRALPAKVVKRLPGDMAEVEDSEWQRGIIFDIDIPDVLVSSVVLKRELHRRGIFSTADMLAHQADARAAVLDVVVSEFFRRITSNNDGGGS
jgi:hypothetical protein